LHFSNRQTNRQTDKQMDSTEALSRSRCHERRLNKNMKYLIKPSIIKNITHAHN